MLAADSRHVVECIGTSPEQCSSAFRRPVTLTTHRSGSCCAIPLIKKAHVVGKAPLVSSLFALPLRLPEGPGASTICRSPLSQSLPRKADKRRSTVAPSLGRALDMPHLSEKLLHCNDTASTPPDNPPPESPLSVQTSPLYHSSARLSRSASIDATGCQWKQQKCSSFASGNLPCVLA